MLLSNPATLALQAGKAAIYGLGVYKAIELTVGFATWFRGLFPYSERDLNTHRVGVSTLANYTHITGLGDAFLSCPWPWQKDSGACYSAGWMKNPIGQAFNFVIKLSSCYSKEKGPTGMAACVLDLSQQDRTSFEEQVEVVATFALLIFVWYRTLPKSQEEKKQKKIA